MWLSPGGTADMFLRAMKIKNFLFWKFSLGLFSEVTQSMEK
jgi:hypothetical protein